jgi:hypothetical protein
MRHKLCRINDIILIKIFNSLVFTNLLTLTRQSTPYMVHQFLTTITKAYLFPSLRGSQEFSPTSLTLKFIADFIGEIICVEKKLQSVVSLQKPCTIYGVFLAMARQG